MHNDFCTLLCFSRSPCCCLVRKKTEFVETIGLYDVTKVKLRVHFEMRARAKGIFQPSF